MKKNYFKTFLACLISLTLTCSTAFSQITSFPHTTTFESGFGDWNQSTSDNFDWSLRSNATTPSGGTGPQASPYGSSGTSGYVFTESSNPRTNNDVARIYATYDLSTASSASIAFNYHQYSSYGCRDLIKCNKSRL